MAVEVFGPYRLLSRLGVGGMGEVWRAHDTRKDREVALKVLGAWLGTDPDYARRFRREAALVARLNTPSIVPIHDYGDIDGRLFIEMPLIDGHDLQQLLDDSGPLPPARAVGIIDQVADALDVAHTAGLLHRDVKPSNVLITTRRGRDVVYLIDFGIAAAAEATTTMSPTGTVLGTLTYMAPERFDGNGDHRSDIYALACVLHAALTGQAPFNPPTGAYPLAFYLDAHRHHPRPQPSQLAPQVPTGFDAVIACGMATHPADRFPTAGDLATAAHTALLTPPFTPPEPPAAHPDTTAQPPDAGPTAAPPRAERTGHQHIHPATATPPTSTTAAAATPPPPTESEGAQPTAPPRRPSSPGHRPGWARRRKVGLGGGLCVALLMAAAFWVPTTVSGSSSVVSTSPSAATTTVAFVPDLVGRPQLDATNQIIAAHLQPGTVTQQPSPVDQTGKVLSSNPQSGAQVTQRSTVDLVIGSGPATVNVPALKGTNPPDAAATLKTASLTLGKQTTQPTSDNTLIGKIINTNPAPGTTVKPGSAVDIIVGAKQRTVQVSDTGGQTQNTTDDPVPGDKKKKKHNDSGDTPTSTPSPTISLTTRSTAIPIG